jgi:hypothetical protein
VIQSGGIGGNAMGVKAPLGEIEAGELRDEDSEDAESS